MSKGIIYVHINKINGKAYVGQTTQELKRRFRKQENNFNSYQNCTVFYDALKKYGWNNFETVLLATSFSQEELDKLEEHFIKFYNSTVPSGYNSLDYANTKVVFTEEIKNKISNKAKLRPKKELAKGMKKRIPHIIINEEACKQCGDCKQIKPLILFSKHKEHWDGFNRICKDCSAIRFKQYREANPIQTLSPEELKQSYQDRRKALSEGISNRFKSDPTYKQKISQARSKALTATNIETGEVLTFSSALEAKKHGFQNSNIGQAIKFSKPYKGYIWAFSNN